MGVLTSKKIITTASEPLACDGRATIELTFNATNSLESNPVDIMLLLDQSGSMAGEPLSSLKIAANEFINIIDEATNNGVQTGILAGGTTIGIVRFDTTATFVNPPGMTTNVANLKDVINNLTSLDFTCHGCALYTGRTSFDPTSPRKKIMILFTDGDNNTFTYDADVQATEAKNQGIEIYAIGLGNNINVDNLTRWATDPSHVIIAPTIDDLLEAFEELAANINVPGASNIDILDTLYDDFDIIGTPSITFTGTPVPTPTTTATISSDKKSIRWTISELGKNGNESASLKFDIQHVSSTSGSKPVNKEITYSDNEGNTAEFTNQDNYIDVICSRDIKINCCIPPEVVTIDGCNEYQEVTLPITGDGYDLSCSGRLLSIFVNLKGLCPNREVAIGVIIFEEVNNALVPRGFKAVKVTTPPPGSDPSYMCRTVRIGSFDFILPEDTTICSEREFRVKVIAHYSDSLSNYSITC